MNQLIKIFYEIDNYCKEYKLSCKKFLIDDNLKNVITKNSMVLSEIMTIVVYFHQSRFRDFKSYYKTMKDFSGMKLHLVINGSGEILSFCLISGNISDIDENVIDKLTKNIFGKLIGDRGYISKKIFEKLLKKHITMTTKIRSNMKNKLVTLEDKLILRKRAVIESVNNILKEKLLFFIA